MYERLSTLGDLVALPNVLIRPQDQNRFAFQEHPCRTTQ